MTYKSLFLCLTAILLPSSSLVAGPIPYPNPGTIAPEQVFQTPVSGDVTAYFYGSTAAFSEQIGLLVNGVQQGSWGLANHTSSFGQAFHLGTVTAGDTLVFALMVADTGYTLYSDSRFNPDGINHVYSTAFDGATNNGVLIPAGTFVGFEDSLQSFSDLNYNDETFVFTTTTPEASSLLLTSFGILAAGFGGWRRKSAHALRLLF